MRNSIFYSALTDENGNILVDENGNKLLAEIGITDTEVFQNLTQAYMPKNEKIIKDIIIQIDDDITVEQLSEGEKKLILVKTVLEILSDEKNKGENWWTECVSDKIRKSADSRKAEEDKIKWHTHRGTSMINYVDFADLANIMGQNYDLFEVHIVSLEWAKQIFTTLEKSRNVIMHSGELGERDIERIGINIRDWISQVGA